ncbi:MAG: hypothetical protein PHR78_02635 [Eubacteriales bacterium]|nr:hypothetical protein [Eubacteriales bacterium]MDD4541050.1 hypothetical protein [Eubacteriales bacterium]
MRKRDGLSGLAMVFGIAAAALQIYYWLTVGAVSDPTGLGALLGIEFSLLTMVEASIISLLVAVVLNIIGFFGNSRGLTIISFLFYLLALILMPFWGFMGIPSLILQFVAIFSMRSTLVERR